MSDNEEGEEEPMEVTSEISEMQQPSSLTAELPAGIQGTSIKNEEGAIVDVFGEWPENDRPEKCKMELQKALQSWCNRNKDRADCSVVSASEDGYAQIMIRSATALDVLHSLDGNTLTYKDQKPVTIKLMSPPLSKPWTQISNSNSVDVPSPSATWDGKVQEEGLSTGATTAGQETFSYTVPLDHFWYVKQGYKEEMKRIERENGVRIIADVKVSLEADQKTGGNLNNAVHEFTNLVQKCLGDSRSVPLKLEDLKLEDWKDTLKFIQRDEAKLVLTVSSDEITVQGPRKSRNIVCKSLKTPHTTGTNAEQINFGASRSQDASPKIDIDIKDPLVDAGLTMDECYWKVMTTVFDKKIEEIKAKFSVVFRESNISQRKVSVRVYAANSVEAPRSHALRALLHLYQKAATSTMSCSLLFPEKAKEVEYRLGEIRSQHPGIEAGEKYGAWRLSGLPENLGPAVYELEKTMGGPVFKEEDKQKIGYTRHTMSSIAPAMEGGATAGGITGENEETCPICMDAFTDKRKLKCAHEFCSECIGLSVKSLGPICPVCKAVFGEMKGDQPDGTMRWNRVSTSLPGFPHCGTININYHIPSGTQSKRHPTPGKALYGISRAAYLPDNQEGREVLQLLKKAFDQKLIFTVGTSRTTGADGQVTWNDIHHKTSTHGGPECYGYPDPGYLSRVKEELKAKGIM